MKKFLSLLLITSLLISFSSCSFGKADEGATDLPTYEPLSELTSEKVSSDESSENAASTSAVVSSTTGTTAAVTVENSGVVTYYSDNPNNKYIRAISEKYGVDSSCLIAFIKVNSNKPGATVLQFDGSKDASGNVIQSEETLKYVYDVPDHGVIKKASGKKSDNDGYRYSESYVNYNLAVKYLVPQIEEMKIQRRYEDYFA